MSVYIETDKIVAMWNLFEPKILRTSRGNGSFSLIKNDKPNNMSATM